MTGFSYFGCAVSLRLSDSKDVLLALSLRLSDSKDVLLAWMTN